VSYQWVKLSQVCEKITDGSHFSPSTSEHGFPYITVKDISDLGIDYHGCKFISDIDFLELKKNGCAPKINDLLFSKDGTVGKVAIVKDDRDFVVLSSLAILTSNTKVINPNFLFYVLRSPYFISTAVGRKTGVAIKRIILKNLKEIAIPLPSLATQQKIVAKLDAIFAEIDKAVLGTEANVKNAESLFKCYLFEVFEQGGSEWTDKKLTDVAIYMGRGKSKHRPRNDVSLYGGEYPFIQTGDVRNSDKFITNYTQTYNEKGLAQSKLWKASTVCITIAANIAEIGILGFDACFPDSVIGIVVDKEKVSEDFLYLMLVFAQQRIKDKSKGSAQENINLGTFEDMLFKVAPLEQQEIIVQRFNNLKISTNFIRESSFKKINELSNLKNSILKQAFNGELVKD